VYLPDVNDIWAPPIGPCKIHGAVNQVFARLINDQKLTFDGQQKLNLNAIGVETYTDKTFYGDDYAFDASIQIRDTNDIQTIMTANPNNTNNFNIWGKPGGAIYQNFNNSNQNTKDGRTITIKNFGTNDGGWDRISLQKERKSLGVTQDTSSYLISQSNNIQRTVTKSIPTGVNVNQYTDIVVEGSRVGNMLPGEIEAKMNQFKAGTDNDWFTKR